MTKSILHSAYNASKVAGKIIGKAQGKILRTSFDTGKQIAVLSKEAGFQAFNISKKLIKETVKLAVENQKEIFQTSGDAFKEAKATFQQKEDAVKDGKKKKTVKIDDLV